MVDLYVIESPFQLLCAVEAKAAMGKGSLSTLVVKYSRNKNNNNQIENMLKLFSFDKIYRVHSYVFLTFSDFILGLLIFFWMKIGKEFRNIFIGEPRSLIMTCFVQNLRNHKSFFMDDGNITPYIQNRIWGGHTLKDLVIESAKISKFRNLYLTCLGINRSFVSLPNWFTCFDITPMSTQLVVKNSFSFCKETLLVNATRLENVVYYIGGNLSESGILSLDEEINHINKLLAFYKEQDKQVVYCAHRRESQQKLSLLSSFAGISSIRHAQYPLEIDFGLKSENIVNVASFMSTALFTLVRIYDTKSAVLFRLPIHVIKKEFQEEMLDVYKAYENEKRILTIDVESIDYL